MILVGSVHPGTSSGGEPPSVGAAIIGVAGVKGTSGTYWLSVVFVAVARAGIGMDIYKVGLGTSMSFRVSPVSSQLMIQMTCNCTHSQSRIKQKPKQCTATVEAMIKLILSVRW